MALPLFGEVSCHLIRRDGTAFMKMEPVLTEHSLTVLVNKTLRFSLVCLPQYQKELILGHLVTEGYLSSMEEVTSFVLSPDGENAEVTLCHPPEKRPLARVMPIPYETEWLFSLADRFAAGMPLHQKTFATHSCFLAARDTLLFRCEDIGRHNALDKAVGFALLNEIPLTSCILYSSGRMPLDMVQKAIYAGLPVLCSKGAPTQKAVALARQYDLTLFCATRKDSMKQFSPLSPHFSTTGGSTL